MSFWGPVVAGVIGAGASMLGDRSSAKGQAEANEANLAIARENIAFQREGMQNRHQWEVEDLRKAGLNPILSANSGGPIGMGSSAVMQNTRPNRGELYLATAKAISDTILTREMAETERTKQELNRVETANKRSGSVGLPGLLNVPIAGLGGLAHSAGSSLKNFFSNAFRHETYNPSSAKGGKK